MRLPRIAPRIAELPRLVVMAGALGCAAPGLAADAAAGKSVAAACADCHQPRDWEGENPGSLESLIRDVVRGAVKHSTKVTLGDTEIANIAAYWAAAAK